MVLQVIVLLIALAVASVVSLRQSQADFREERGAPLRSAALGLAGLDVIRSMTSTRPVPASLATYAQQYQQRADATSVRVAAPDGTVLYGASPQDAGTRMRFGAEPRHRVAVWTGDMDLEGQRSLVVQVPVFAPDVANQPPRVVGYVMIADAYPSVLARAQQILPDVATFLGIGLALGVAGAWLLARLIKRRTRGLEPAEIAALADQREALLHSIREGVVALSPDGTVTVLSDSARDLLGLPKGVEGRRLEQLDLPADVLDVLTGADDLRDRPLVVAGRVLVVNRNAVLDRGRRVGTVTTLRDRTELLAMQSELSARVSITETLRAQTHEFSNQLHTISGLVQLGEYDEVNSYVGALTRQRAEISGTVTATVQDASVSALLVAKMSLAAERGVRIVLARDGCSLPRLEPDLSSDVGTVLGNLVDNAVDATVSGGGTLIEVRFGVDSDLLVVQVSDSGPGVSEDALADIFTRGYSTKPADAIGRGVGLALVQLVCRRRGGSVQVRNESGAVFTARLRRTVTDAVAVPGDADDGVRVSGEGN